MSETTKVRLDKWLWAARFFKTRALAKKAIEGGKVEYNGDRCKSSKMAEIGAMLTLPQGWDKKRSKLPLYLISVVVHRKRHCSTRKQRKALRKGSLKRNGVN